MENIDNITALYDLWREKATEDPDIQKDLEKMKDDQNEIYESFYKELEFGTAGLRGIIGAGTNRMNIYTVRRATQGLCEWVNSKKDTVKKAAIAYDSRIKSYEFARAAASVFAANGIKVYIYKELMPTPMLSFAIRHLGCDTGVVVTASHNPSKYNGYKAYGNDGCQLSVENSAAVLDFVNQVDMFSGVKTVDFDEGLSSGKIEYIGNDVIEEFYKNVLSCSVEAVKTELKVVYTPLNGTGNKPVREILKRIGITDVTVVPEQENPDGNFPTAPYPNPEIREAFGCALKLADKVKPDILLATDPDCDRVGIAVKKDDDYVLMSGNDVGCLLLNYVLSRRKAAGTLPEHPVSVKSIVTTPLADKIAEKYGCESRSVLTGFKYIGGEITKLEAVGQYDRFVFGFEESYGYMAGGYVRDKDAVVTSMLICEMAAHYKSLGKSLLDVMEDIYKEFGVFVSVQHSYTFEGAAGMAKISGFMDTLRHEPPKEIAGLKVLSVRDIEASTATDLITGKTEKIDLPKSNVLCYSLDKDASLIIRPSGTEPKIKAYITAVGQSVDEAKALGDKILTDVNGILR